MAEPRDMQIVLDLPHLGELVSAVVTRYAETHDVPAPESDEEWRAVMRHAWSYCLLMADRVQMANTSLDDLEALPTFEPPAEPSPPSPFDRPLDTRRLSDRERAARRPRP